MPKYGAVQIESVMNSYGNVVIVPQQISCAFTLLEHEFICYLYIISLAYLQQIYTQITRINYQRHKLNRYVVV